MRQQLQQQTAAQHHHLNAAAFEFALNDISMRQRRCHHAGLLLTAACALWLLFCASGLTCSALWHVNPAPLFVSVKSLTLSVCCLVAVRLARKKLALESEDSMCARLNRTLALCGFDLAYDVYSGKLFSKRRRAQQHVDGHVPLEMEDISGGGT
jgi:hypothetical protein